MTDLPIPEIDEIWKPVPGYEEYYLISSTGKLFSKRKNKVLKTTLNDFGYFRATLYKDGEKAKHTKIHILVALSFLGERKGRQVNHINRVRTDNNLSNLEYVSVRENALKGVKNKGYAGVFWSNKQKRYRVSISYGGKTIHGGTFKNKEDAERRRNEMYIEYGIPLTDLHFLPVGLKQSSP